MIRALFLCFTAIRRVVLVRRAMATTVHTEKLTLQRPRQQRLIVDEVAIEGWQNVVVLPRTLSRRSVSPDTVEELDIRLSWLRETGEVRYYHLFAALSSRPVGRGVQAVGPLQARRAHAVKLAVQHGNFALEYGVNDLLAGPLGSIASQDLRRFHHQSLIRLKTRLEKHDTRAEASLTCIQGHANTVTRDEVTGIQQETQRVARNIRVCIHIQNTPDWQPERIELFERIEMARQELAVDAGIATAVEGFFGNRPIPDQDDMPTSPF
jgi:hypothetical protein